MPVNQSGTQSKVVAPPTVQPAPTYPGEYQNLSGGGRGGGGGSSGTNNTIFNSTSSILDTSPAKAIPTVTKPILPANDIAQPGSQAALTLQELLNGKLNQQQLQSQLKNINSPASQSILNRVASTQAETTPKTQGTPINYQQFENNVNIKFITPQFFQGNYLYNGYIITFSGTLATNQQYNTNDAKDMAYNGLTNTQLPTYPAGADVKPLNINLDQLVPTGAGGLSQGQSPYSGGSYTLASAATNPNPSNLNNPLRVSDITLTFKDLGITPYTDVAYSPTGQLVQPPVPTVPAEFMYTPTGNPFAIGFETDEGLQPSYSVEYDGQQYNFSIAPNGQIQYSIGNKGPIVTNAASAVAAANYAAQQGTQIHQNPQAYLNQFSPVQLGTGLSLVSPDQSSSLPFWFRNNPAINSPYTQQTQALNQANLAAIEANENYQQSQGIYNININPIDFPRLYNAASKDIPNFISGFINPPENQIKQIKNLSPELLNYMNKQVIPYQIAAELPNIGVSARIGLPARGFGALALPAIIGGTVVGTTGAYAPEIIDFLSQPIVLDSISKALTSGVLISNASTIIKDILTGQPVTFYQLGQGTSIGLEAGLPAGIASALLTAVPAISPILTQLETGSPILARLIAYSPNIANSAINFANILTSLYVVESISNNQQITFANLQSNYEEGLAFGAVFAALEPAVEYLPKGIQALGKVGVGASGSVIGSNLLSLLNSGALSSLSTDALNAVIGAAFATGNIGLEDLTKNLPSLKYQEYSTQRPDVKGSGVTYNYGKFQYPLISLFSSADTSYADLKAQGLSDQEIVDYLNDKSNNKNYNLIFGTGNLLGNPIPSEFYSSANPTPNFRANQGLFASPSDALLYLAGLKAEAGTSTSPLDIEKFQLATNVAYNLKGLITPESDTLNIRLEDRPIFKEAGITADQAGAAIKDILLSDDWRPYLYLFGSTGFAAEYAQARFGGDVEAFLNEDIAPQKANILAQQITDALNELTGKDIFTADKGRVNYIDDKGIEDHLVEIKGNSVLELDEVEKSLASLISKEQQNNQNVGQTLMGYRENINEEQTPLENLKTRTGSNYALSKENSAFSPKLYTDPDSFIDALEQLITKSGEKGAIYDPNTQTNIVNALENIRTIMNDATDTGRININDLNTAVNDYLRIIDNGIAEGNIRSNTENYLKYKVPVIITGILGTETNSYSYQNPSAYRFKDNIDALTAAKLVDYYENGGANGANIDRLANIFLTLGDISPEQYEDYKNLDLDNSKVTDSMKIALTDFIENYALPSSQPVLENPASTILPITGQTNAQALQALPNPSSVISQTNGYSSYTSQTTNPRNNLLNMQSQGLLSESEKNLIPLASSNNNINNQIYNNIGSSVIPNSYSSSLSLDPYGEYAAYSRNLSPYPSIPSTVSQSSLASPSQLTSPYSSPYTTPNPYQSLYPYLYPSQYPSAYPSPVISPSVSPSLYSTPTSPYSSPYPSTYPSTYPYYYNNTRRQFKSNVPPPPPPILGGLSTQGKGAGSLAGKAAFPEQYKPDLFSLLFPSESIKYSIPQKYSTGRGLAVRPFPTNKQAFQYQLLGEEPTAKELAQLKKEYAVA